jgi:hypothetical protein
MKKAEVVTTPLPADLQCADRKTLEQTQRAQNTPGQRQILTRLFATLFCVLSTSSFADSQKILRSSELIDLIGVNTHLNYNDGAYANLENVVKDLKFLGVHHVRDALPGTDSQPALQGRDGLARLTRENIRLNILFSSGWTSTSIAWLRVLETQMPGAIASVEGYNEINNFPPVFDGQTGAAAAKRGQNSLYASIKSDPVLNRIPVVDMTGFEMIRDPEFSYGTSLVGYADVMNVHIYPQNDAQPSALVNPTRPLNYNGLKTELPKIITEFGYSSKQTMGQPHAGINDLVQAKGVLNGLFDAARSGYEKLYLYELLDEKPDPDMKYPEFHFGLFTFANEPKSAAWAIRNLTGILSRRSGDGSALADSETQPIKVDLAQPDVGIPILSLVLDKKDGSKLIAVWRETPFWDETMGHALQPRAIRAVISFGTQCTTIRTYDPLKSIEPGSISSGSALLLTVVDHVQLVECEK